MALADLDILIVDDHEAMRMLLARALAKAGVANIRQAQDGAEALTLLEQAPARLILVDQNMPGMDGLAFVRAVRGNAALGAPRIIMISGHTGAEHTAHARAAGADAALAKPVAPRELLAAIEALFAV